MVCKLFAAARPYVSQGRETNLYNLDQAREKAVAALNHIEIMVEEFCSKTPNECDPRVDELLDDVQRNIMRKALRIELE